MAVQIKINPVPQHVPNSHVWSCWSPSRASITNSTASMENTTCETRTSRATIKVSGSFKERRCLDEQSCMFCMICMCFYHVHPEAYLWESETTSATLNIPNNWLGSTATFNQTKPVHLPATKHIQMNPSVFSTNHPSTQLTSAGSGSWAPRARSMNEERWLDGFDVFALLTKNGSSLDHQIQTKVINSEYNGIIMLIRVAWIRKASKPQIM